MIQAREQTIFLGDVARDTITGYEGRVIGITEWLYQCRRLGIQPMKLDKEGRPFDIQWFDELQCEVVEAIKKEVEPKPNGETGGPMPTPVRNSDPKR